MRLTSSALFSSNVGGDCFCVIGDSSDPFGVSVAHGLNIDVIFWYGDISANGD